MAEKTAMQYSFNSGEWAPALYSRVDIAKYHSGAALLQNFYIDYRGGATTRPGTRYILPVKTLGARLIPFQASFNVSYVLEFGNNYIRFYNNGAPVLEPTKSFTSVNIGTSTITSTAHGYSNGDWIQITAGSIVGTLGGLLNGNYYIIAGATTNTYTLTDLFGNAVSFSGLVYTSGGTTARIYTLMNYSIASLNNYNSGTGIVTLNTSVAHNIPVGGTFTIANITGTGTNFSSCNGTFTAVSGTTGTALAFSVGTGLTITTITGGNINQVPYLTGDLAKIKFAQSVNTLVLCHPSYPPYQLVLNSAANWSVGAITFGATLNPPSAGLGISSTMAAGSINYAYVVTTVDVNGIESGPSGFIAGAFNADIRAAYGQTNTISWTAIANAAYYNVYRAVPSYSGAVPSGSIFGYIGYTQGTSFKDSSIVPDYSTTPPIPSNPFSGTGVASINLTGSGSGYSSVPIVTIGAPPVGTTAQATATCTANNWTLSGANRWDNGTFPLHATVRITFASGVVIDVTAWTNLGGNILTINTYNFVTGLSLTSSGGSLLTTDTITSVTNGGFPTGFTVNPTASINWYVSSLTLTNPGTGYVSAPGVTFSAGAASATTTLAGGAIGIPSNLGNSTVAAIFQQRLWLAAPIASPSQINASVTGGLFNFNFSVIPQANDSLSGSISGNQLNSIKSMIGMPSGLMILTDKQGFILNGGSPGSAITPANFVANPQSYSGASDLAPIVANADIIYVQAKGSVVRNLVYNFYTAVYTGTDISVMSSHLFYGYTIKEWAWAEEPFKVVYAVRSDGQMLNLTFLKEQELVAWSHLTTLGTFLSVCSVVESGTLQNVDAVYTIVQRTINSAAVQYVERFAEQNYTGSASVAWCVDAGIQYNGAMATTFSGAQHLAGQTVTGLADGIVIPPFTMPANGTFTLATAASLVTVGLGYTCQLQTLPLDVGEPTIQGKRKQITGVTVRVKDALGLQMGGSFSTLVTMKDLVLGNVGSASNAIVTNLVTSDTRTIIDASFTVPGQYCIQQSNPYPATILGVIPEFTMGDSQ